MSEPHQLEELLSFHLLVELFVRFDPLDEVVSNPSLIRLRKGCSLSRTLCESIHRSRDISTSRLKNRVPLYKGQTSPRRSVENGKGSRPSLRCLILLNRGRGFSDHI